MAISTAILRPLQVVYANERCLVPPRKIGVLATNSWTTHDFTKKKIPLKCLSNKPAINRVVSPPVEDLTDTPACLLYTSDAADDC